MTFCRDIYGVHERIPAKRKTNIFFALESWALQKTSPYFVWHVPTAFFFFNVLHAAVHSFPFRVKECAKSSSSSPAKQREDFLRRRRRRRRQTTEIAFVLRPDDPTYRRRRGTQNLRASKKGEGLCSVPYWKGAPPARVLARLGCIHGRLDKN